MPEIKPIPWPPNMVKDFIADYSMEAEANIIDAFAEIYMRELRFITENPRFIVWAFDVLSLAEKFIRKTLYAFR